MDSITDKKIDDLRNDVDAMLFALGIKRKKEDLGDAEHITWTKDGKIIKSITRPKL